MSALSTTKQLCFELSLDPTRRNRRLAGQLARQGTVLASYLAAVRTIINSGPDRAWTRQQLWEAVVTRNLLTGHANWPLLKKALDRLLGAGEIVRVARGYYRMAGLGPVGVGIAIAAQ